jgi:hypothetical protein
MVTEIKKLKDELQSLIDLQKNLVVNEEKSEITESLRKEENELLISESNNINLKTENKLNTSSLQNLTNTNNLNDSNTNNIMNIPNIEQFFTFNGKISLVDSDKNLWHLTKCKKYDKFVTNNINSGSKEDILYAFLEYYQNLPKNKVNSNTNTNSKVTSSVIESNNIEKEKYIQTSLHNLTTQHSEYNDKIKITDNLEEDDFVVDVDCINDNSENENHINENKNESLILSESD